jgi:hypothetical protein
MGKIKQMLLGGTLLVYLSVNSLIIGPSDNKVTTIVGPYLLLLLGLGLLIFGFVIVFSIKEISMLKKFALAFSYPLIAAGGSAIAFSWFGSAMRAGNMGLLGSNWGTLVLGAGLILAGFLLQKTWK